MQFFTISCAVKSQNKGHFGTVSLFFFVRRLSSLGGSKCIRTDIRSVYILFVGP